MDCTTPTRSNLRQCFSHQHFQKCLRRLYVYQIPLSQCSSFYGSIFRRVKFSYPLRSAQLFLPRNLPLPLSPLSKPQHPLCCNYQNQVTCKSDNRSISWDGKTSITLYMSFCSPLQGFMLAYSYSCLKHFCFASSEASDKAFLLGNIRSQSGCSTSSWVVFWVVVAAKNVSHSKAFVLHPTDCESYFSSSSFFVVISSTSLQTIVISRLLALIQAPCPEVTLQFGSRIGPSDCILHRWGGWASKFLSLLILSSCTPNWG